MSPRENCTSHSFRFGAESILRNEGLPIEMVKHKKIELSRYIGNMVGDFGMR